MISTQQFNVNTTAEQVAIALSSNIKGKTVVITGVSVGSIAQAAVEALVSAQVGTIFATARTPSKAQAVFDSLEDNHGTKLVNIQMDLSEFDSVRSAISSIESHQPVIDAIICSAGIMASPFQKTTDGIESQFQTCHLSHFLFVNGLRSRLSPSARIVSVTSLGHHIGGVRLDDYNFQDGNSYDPWLGYGQAKSANVLFAKSLAKRGYKAFSLHPGIIRTGIMRNLSLEQEKKHGFSDESGKKLAQGLTASGISFVTTQQGAAQYLYAAFDPDLSDTKVNGSHILECRIANDMAAPHATDEMSSSKIIAEKLWSLSEKLVGQNFN